MKGTNLYCACILWGVHQKRESGMHSSTLLSTLEAHTFRAPVCLPNNSCIELNAFYSQNLSVFSPNLEAGDDIHFEIQAKCPHRILLVLFETTAHTNTIHTHHMNYCLFGNLLTPHFERFPSSFGFRFIFRSGVFRIHNIL